ncbi:MAG: 7-carboxy-7-deazaguanine synthase [Saprospiraceae bacterium]|nr:7-carboxy-7-deazaguanine synthase [Saprospiraceae bacterium]
MAYKIKEIFYTLQGEGAQAGRPAVFCRFAGCNLWTGRERDRSKAICQFCDTDFVGIDGENGGRYKTANDVAAKVLSVWGDPSVGKPYVVCTGGEPALQLDAVLVEAFHAVGFEVAIETNGTVPLPKGVDWVCVSPKAGTELVILRGSELKLVFPQKGAEPELFKDLDFDYFYLQPMDNTFQKINTQMTLDYCLKNPQWRLSLQTHKILEIP